MNERSLERRQPDKKLTAVERARQSSRFAGGDRSREHTGHGDILSHRPSTAESQTRQRNVRGSVADNTNHRVQDDLLAPQGVEPCSPHRPNAGRTTQETSAGAEFDLGRLHNTVRQSQSSVELTDSIPQHYVDPRHFSRAPVQTSKPHQQAGTGVRASFENMAYASTHVTPPPAQGNSDPYGGLSTKRRVAAPNPMEPHSSRLMTPGSNNRSANVAYCVYPEEDRVVHNQDAQALHTQLYQQENIQRKGARDLAPRGELGGFSPIGAPVQRPVSRGDRWAKHTGNELF